MLPSCLPRLARALPCLLALLGTPALATPVAVTVDEKIGQALLAKSSDEAELAALRALTGIDSLVLGSKADVGKDTPISLAEGLASTWILTDATAPGYFALKFGIGGTGASANTFFFRNIGDLNQLVWSNEQVGFLTDWSCGKDQTQCQVERLSHYITSPAALVQVKEPVGQPGAPGGSGSTGGEEGHEVPEPGSLALLAMGALAVGAVRRRRMRA